MKTLFLISGKAESGKDTLAKLLMKHLKGDFLTIAHIADEVKHIAKAEYGWNGIKDEKGRSLLQKIGDGERQKNPNIWIDKFIENLKALYVDRDNLLSYDAAVIVSDVRYKNEVIELVNFAHEKDIKCITIRVERPDHKSHLTEEQLKNSSEVDLDNWGIWDFKIINDDTIDSLDLVARRILELSGVKYE